MNHLKSTLCRWRFLTVFLVLFVSLVFLNASVSATAGVVLVQNGESRAVIVLPRDPVEPEQQAADELVEHIRLISGAEPVVSAAGEELQGLLPIFIGDAADEGLDDLIEEEGEGRRHRADPWSFAIVVEEEGIHLRGLSPEGSRTAAYELLEQLGVRWYMPGEVGRVVPENPEPAVDHQETVLFPSFTGRSFGTRGEVERDWRRRNRLGGDVPPGTLYRRSVGDIEEYPDRYALVDGERNSQQLCVSNESTLDAMVELTRHYFSENSQRRWITMGTHRGSHCECDGCEALDPEKGGYGPFTGGRNVTDRYIYFYNRVLEEIEDEFPDRRISLQMVSPHVLPPVNVRGKPNLDVIAWTNGYCRIHGAGNPNCPERMMVARRTARWVDRLEGRYYERTPWGNVAGPGFIFPLVHRYRNELPEYYRHGVQGFRIASYSNWASENPSAFIGARLLWDHDADVDSLLEEFYGNFYGPAEVPMRRYHELMEYTAENADYHTGTAIDMPYIYSADVRKKAGAYLADAFELVEPEGIFYRRISKVRLALDYLEAFVEMQELRNRHDYSGAAEALDRALSLNKSLSEDFEYPLIIPRSVNYLKRFFGNTVREAYQLTENEGELVVGMDDVWDFLIDPDKIGEDMAYHSPETTGGNWRTIKSWTSSWSNEGLRYYRGDAWYRQYVQIPEEFRNRTVKLWVGGVDERARVWVNGQKLGDSPVGAFSPFEFDATGAVRPGEDNLVVIRAGNYQMQEVGTGGLLAPVFFYAPVE